MDVLRKDKKDHITHILCNDHIPNNAFKNEFQTLSFTLKLNFMEIIEHEMNGYDIEENTAYLVLDIDIRNNTNEKLELYNEDFMLSINKTKPYIPEDNFNVNNQFTDCIEIDALASINGKFIFITPKSINKIDFFYLEFSEEEYVKEYHLRYKIIK